MHDMQPQECSDTTVMSAIGRNAIDGRLLAASRSFLECWPCRADDERVGWTGWTEVDGRRVCGLGNRPFELIPRRKSLESTRRVPGASYIIEASLPK